MSRHVLRRILFLRAMGLRYLLFKVQSLFARPHVHFERHLNAFRGSGLEVGGPSAVFRADGLFPVYESAQRVDNVTFANKTRWEGDVMDGQNFIFHSKKEAGTQFVLEGAACRHCPRRATTSSCPATCSSTPRTLCVRCTNGGAC